MVMEEGGAGHELMLKENCEDDVTVRLKERKRKGLNSIFICF